MSFKPLSIVKILNCKLLRTDFESIGRVSILVFSIYLYGAMSVELTPDLPTSSSQLGSVSGSTFYSTHTEPKGPLYNTILVGCRFSSPIRVMRAGAFLSLNRKGGMQWSGEYVSCHVCVNRCRYQRCEFFFR